MFRKNNNNGVEKRLKKISKQEAASIKLLEKQVKLWILTTDDDYRIATNKTVELMDGLKINESDNCFEDGKN